MVQIEKTSWVFPFNCVQRLAFLAKWSRCLDRSIRALLSVAHYFLDREWIAVIISTNTVMDVTTARIMRIPRPQLAIYDLCVET